MNRIYKEIWNEILVTLAAVSEFVKGKVKMFLMLSQSKSLENFILVSRIFSQIFNQSTLVAVMNSFTKVAWTATGIYINHELENGISHLTGFKGEYMEKDTSFMPMHLNQPLKLYSCSTLSIYHSF